MSYWGNLSLRLAAGAVGFDQALRRRHAAYLAGQQRADGGFSGRQGPSDPYYTSFALRGLALLGQLNASVARRAAMFLQSRLAAPQPSVDLLSLILGAMVLEVSAGVDVFRGTGKDRLETFLAAVEPLRRDDGGYAKNARSNASSTYQTFLVMACGQLLGMRLARADETRAFVVSRQRPDGGFVELEALHEGGTSPTAAAIGLLRLLGEPDQALAARATRFLAAMQNVEGGLRAHGRIPVADLLSTFTGLVALHDLRALDHIDLAAAHRYVTSLEKPEGGFRAGPWDDSADVEYTFYGLGALALLSRGPT